MSPVIIIAASIIIVLAFIGGAFLFLKKNNPKSDRARQIITGQSGIQKHEKINPADKRRAEIAKKLKEQGDDSEEQEGKKKNTLRMRLMQTGKDITVRQYFIYSGVSGVVCVALALILKLSPLLTIFLAIIGFFGVPRYVVGRMAKRRQKKFLEEFADALEAMVRLLKSGMPVSEAIAMIAREYTGTIGDEMNRIYDSQRIGVPIHEAAQECAVRIPLPEVKMFATGLTIQAQTGSSLSEILINLADVIRARYKLARKVKALSSEAKASAGIIGALPVVVGTGMYVMKPEHIMVFFEDPFGKVLFAGAIIWMCFGVLAMKIMINFKV